MKKILVLLLFCILGNIAQAAEPIDISYDNGVYHIVLAGDKIKKKIKFVSHESLITNREAHKRSGARLTVNAGFFDPKNGKTISYLVSDNVTAEDPIFNENLMSNPLLRQNLDKILNRTEFRILECDRDLKYEIAPHKAKVDFGCAVRTSVGAGPLVYPELTLEEEFFVVKEDDKVVRDSISAFQKTSRTIIGIKDDDAHILIFTDEHPMTLPEVQKYCGQLGLDRAMAFDGGSSTSLNYKDTIEVISTKGDGGGRSLKSFMLVY